LEFRDLPIKVATGKALTEQFHIMHLCLGLLHCLAKVGLRRCRFRGSCVGKQLADEFYLPSNTWLLVMDVAAFDSPDRLNAAQHRFG